MKFVGSNVEYYAYSVYVTTSYFHSDYFQYA